MTAVVTSVAVAVRGTGPLADAIRRAVPTDTAPGCAVDVVVQPRYDPAAVAAAGGTARAAGRAYLPVHVEPGRVAIGPLAEPAEPGCYLCLRSREETVRAVAPADHRALWDALDDGTLRPPTVPLGAPVCEAVAALVATELAAIGGRGPTRTSRAVLEVGTATLTVTRHAFLPEPLCAECGTAPDDGPDAGRLVLRQRPTARPDGYRVRDLAAEHDRLLATYVDSRAGLLGGVTVGDSGSLIFSVASGGGNGCPPFDGYGRTFDYRSTVTVAVAEALERYGGLRPRARRTAVRAAFADLGPDRAVDPVVLGLPRQPPGCGSADHSGGYRPDLVLDWVYAYSFQRGGPVLVPETIAYYGTHGHQIAYECSNGCALGGALEEAILHGIFEVAERDAFLLTWYARLPLPRIDPLTSNDPTNRLLVRRLEAATGCRIHVFDATMPEGIPSLFFALVDEADRPGFAKAYFGAGAHLDPERALRSGLLELGGGYRFMTSAMRDGPARAAALVADSDLVAEMADHSLTYADPASWPRAGFLYEREASRPMAEAFPVRHLPAGDVLVDLHHVVDRYLDAGLDVVVVDQTAPEHLAADLSCVKVLVPGTLPMTFGHRNRRADGMPRLHTVPVRLGYRAEPLRDEEINPYPHPFP
jgi:ribosomal protein S12 methylthiotransferase accessory factor